MNHFFFQIMNASISKVVASVQVSISDVVAAVQVPEVVAAVEVPEVDVVHRFKHLMLRNRLPILMQVHLIATISHQI